MRLVTGAILLLAAEQAYAHVHLVTFPHYRTVSQVLLPAAAVLGIVGVGFLVWGTLVDGRMPASPASPVTESNGETPTAESTAGAED